MVTEIKNRLKRIGEPSFFHDSRADSRTIARFCNEIADKVNELVRENNELKEQLKKLNPKPCEHKNINRSDGLDECLDCGIRNY